MSGVKDSDEMGELRDRLYDREVPVSKRKNHQLHDVTREVPTTWKNPPTPKAATPPASSARSEEPAPPEASSSTTTPTKWSFMKNLHYRTKLLLGGVAFFFGALLISSGILLLGNNTISGENISLDVTGPFTIGGGEVLPLQIGITNGNAVPIQSATLIIEYPSGTLAADGSQRQLFNERLALEEIDAGETVNVPVRALIYGEENEAQEIFVSIEYRVEGSNARFFKEAEPLRYKISSSPVSVTADAVKRISSGQATDIVVTVQSNSPNTISDVLVSAEYPIGFDYTSSSPSPSSGENQWLIRDLEPESSQEIVISGVVIGKETDEYAINFMVGVPDENQSDQMVSLFSTAQTEFEIEQPFLNIILSQGNIVNGTKVVQPGERSNVTVEITNTLEDAIYDLKVNVALGGNALSDLEVGPPSGFYDSNNNVITWDVSNSPDLQEIEPGDTARVAYVIEADNRVSRNPEVTMDVTVEGRRVRESQVAERLEGTASGALRVASTPVVGTTITHYSGSVPPEVGSETVYTVALSAANGTNDLTQSELLLQLPTYVTWLDEATGIGVLSYNEAQRTVTWSIGNIAANATPEATFRVGFTPSVGQIDKTPVIVDQQQFRANDQFTDTSVRDTGPARSTELSPESGFTRGNGRVEG